MGYHRAGFEVVGVDIAPQPHYPFEFIQADAMTFPLDGFDAIHASPPCQRYSVMTKKWGRSEAHPDLVNATRDRLVATGVPFVIENVPTAPLVDPVMLCGSMFDLGADGYGLRRHRNFEPHGFSFVAPRSCHHVGPALPVYGHAGGRSRRDGLKFPGTDIWRAGMGIEWMTGKELAEAIPPAFTYHVAIALLVVLDQGSDEPIWTGRFWEGVS